MNEINTPLPLFCPRENCPFYQEEDNEITKSGIYQVRCESDHRQLFWCCGGKHKFSETQYSGIWGKQGSFKEYEQAAKLKTYGLSEEAIADVLEKDVRTILGWTEAIGEKSHHWHVWLCCYLGLTIRFLQMDELWSYVSNKGNQLWVFAALDVPTRFWIHFDTGKRTKATTERFVSVIRLFGNWDKVKKLRITTDGMGAYADVVAMYFSDIKYKFIQIVKVRVKRRLKTVFIRFVKGGPEDFPKGTQNTSYIERLNLTIRLKVSYLARKTLGYCKKPEHCENTLWFTVFDYNYRRYHKSLRKHLRPGRPGKNPFERRYAHNTPAMEMGLTNVSISWKFLLLCPVRYWFRLI